MVLLACSMEGDLANSSAAGIVRELEATDRCFGVLTKPDRIPEGDPMDLWTRVLNGLKYRVGYGYYVTKQPSQKYLTQTNAEARYAEQLFFSQSPWVDELANHSIRFGVPNLQSAISEKLVKEISSW